MVPLSEKSLFYNCDIIPMQVNAVDLAQSMKGDKLWWLWHARLGCPGHQSHKTMFDTGTVEGIFNRTGIKEPSNGHTCPVCFSEKTRKPPSNPTQHIIISSKGSRWHADLGFYKIYSVWGFKCFLLLVFAFFVIFMAFK